MATTYDMKPYHSGISIAKTFVRVCLPLLSIRVASHIVSFSISTYRRNKARGNISFLPLNFGFQFENMRLILHRISKISK